MSRDIYVSLSGARASWKHLEVLSENLANTSTAGFKEQRVAFSLSTNPEDPAGRSYAVMSGNERDFGDGPLIRDGNRSHFALQGRGFFVVSDGEAEHLMRAGAFVVDRDGFLVTNDGARVQGTEGDIRFPEEVTAFRVAEDGYLYDAQGYELGRLRLVDGDEPVPIGEARWKIAGEAREAVGLKVIQGALEGSNAEPVRCMTELIENSRIFQMYQKAIQTSDDMDAVVTSLEKP